MKLLMIVFIIDEMLREQRQKDENNNQKKPKYEQIRELKKENPKMSDGEIAKIVGTTREYVVKVSK